MSKIAGRIGKVYVEEGQEVKKVIRSPLLIFLKLQQK